MGISATFPVARQLGQHQTAQPVDFRLLPWHQRQRICPAAPVPYHRSGQVAASCTEVCRVHGQVSTSMWAGQRGCGQYWLLSLPHVHSHAAAILLSLCCSPARSSRRGPAHQTTHSLFLRGGLPPCACGPTCWEARNLQQCQCLKSDDMRDLLAQDTKALLLFN